MGHLALRDCVHLMSKLVLCIIAAVLVWMYKPESPAASPKPSYREVYVECVKNGGTSCEAVFNFWMETERVYQEKRKFLDAVYMGEVERCLAWNEKQKFKHVYDGNNTCARTAQAHMRDLQ